MGIQHHYSCEVRTRRHTPCTAKSAVDCLIKPASRQVSYAAAGCFTRRGTESITIKTVNGATHEPSGHKSERHRGMADLDPRSPNGGRVSARRGHGKLSRVPADALHRAP